MTVPAIVLHDRGLAVFLDVDGTLLDIADTPDAVVVPPELSRLLAGLRAHPVHAVALISGRSLAALDQLFAPQYFPAAGLHGVERRDAAGVIHRLSVESSQIPAVRAGLAALVSSHPALLLEDKGQTLALHFRADPGLEPLAEAAMADALTHAGPGYHLQRGKAVIELKPRSATKRTAIEAFMGEVPFRGRVPVFVGDDVTDEDGFAAVNAQGGLSVRVGARGGTVARQTLPDVGAVHAWLQTLTAGRPVHEQ
ncbi:MAG: trehalose-phosphatase [Gammaproteobacteria bacterium]|nr:trehalose-phosphatase [Gammaproteobacteria bacterium]